MEHHHAPADCGLLTDQSVTLARSTTDVDTIIADIIVNIKPTSSTYNGVSEEL
jgi:hypothetical protein